MLIKKYSEYIIPTRKYLYKYSSIPLDRHIIRYTITKYIHTLKYYIIYYTYPLIINNITFNNIASNTIITSYKNRAFKIYKKENPLYSIFFPIHYIPTTL